MSGACVTGGQRRRVSPAPRAPTSLIGAIAEPAPDESAEFGALTGSCSSVDCIAHCHDARAPVTSHSAAHPCAAGHRPAQCRWAGAARHRAQPGPGPGPLRPAVARRAQSGPEEGDYAALRAPDLQAEPVIGLGREPHAGRDVRALYEISRDRAGVPAPHRPHAQGQGRRARARPPRGPTGCRPPSTPSTVTCSPGYFSPAKTRALVNVERTLARRTTRLVAVGAQVRDELLEARVGRRAQYVVVPPGTGFPVGAKPGRRPAPPRRCHSTFPS